MQSQTLPKMGNVTKNVLLFFFHTNLSHPTIFVSKQLDSYWFMRDVKHHTGCATLELRFACCKIASSSSAPPSSWPPTTKLPTHCCTSGDSVCHNIALQKLDVPRRKWIFAEKYIVPSFHQALCNWYRQVYRCFTRTNSNLPVYLEIQAFFSRLVTVRGNLMRSICWPITVFISDRQPYS